ncbi:hypothetical protein HanIR_Chr04g0181991 [Helianthus annuus]|nr:hypothetical protein HanIR_Chr04g0181991 [Helianthus annuus]
MMVKAIFKCDSDTNSSEVDTVSIKLQLSLVPNKISASGGKRGMVSYMQVSVATELIYYLIMGYVLFANVNSTETLGGIGGMSYTICFGQIAGFETVDLCFKQKIISEVYISKTINGFLSSIHEQSCWA